MRLEGLKKILFLPQSPASKKLAQWISDIDEDLPRRPNALLQVLRMANNSKPNKTKLADEILKNKELVANVLKLSTEIDGLETINAEDLTQAIELMELHYIQNSIEVDIAKKYTEALMKLGLSSDLDDDEIDPNPLFSEWQSALKMAVIAKALASKSNYERADLAFMGALLYKLPNIIMALHEPQTEKKVHELKNQGNTDEEARLIAYGFNQAELGAKLMKYYSMPKELVELLELGVHKNNKLAEIVNFAGFIASSFMDKSQSPSKMWEHAQKHIKGLNLDFTKSSWADKISVLFVQTLEFEMAVLGA